MPSKFTIHPDIKREILNRPCVVFATEPVEADCKDGRRDDPRLNDPKRQTLDDFQALSKPVNNAKRNHCKRCRETDQRFDATLLGYPVSQVRGNGKYNGTCVGCYWYDPPAFVQLACSSGKRSRK